MSTLRCLGISTVFDALSTPPQARIPVLLDVDKRPDIRSLYIL